MLDRTASADASENRRDSCLVLALSPMAKGYRPRLADMDRRHQLHHTVQCPDLLLGCLNNERRPSARGPLPPPRSLFSLARNGSARLRLPFAVTFRLIMILSPARLRRPQRCCHRRPALDAKCCRIRVQGQRRQLCIGRPLHRAAAVASRGKHEDYGSGSGPSGGRRRLGSHFLIPNRGSITCYIF